MSENKIKHSGLTNFMRHGADSKAVANVLANCDVSPYVGGLPPQLVSLVRPEKRADVMQEFAQCLDKFLVNNLDKIKELYTEKVFDMHDISALFHTECVIKARGTSVFTIKPWSGGFGVVCKVSFPKIHADYALKYFFTSEYRGEHGAQFEIPTAFAANKAEPRDNCPIYMASLCPGHEFMLSQWAGDVADGNVRENQYKIYATNDDEIHARNWRGGRRIDYGETFRTPYGRASFHTRKLFRQIMRAAEVGNVAELKSIYNNANNAQRKKDLGAAIELARYSALATSKYGMSCIIECNMQNYQR